MENYQNQLFPFAYNILGSAEDARDVIQDVLEKYITSGRNIHQENAYLTKAVINQSINFKKRQQRLTSDQIWLPEPLATERADTDIKREEIISYSLLVLLEKLNPKERAVFILKEAFDYQHKDIAKILDSTTENTRKILSRAKSKLSTTQELELFPRPGVASIQLEKYIKIIKEGDTLALEKLLAQDISIAADGGGKVNVVRTYTIGRAAAAELLIFVFRTFQKMHTCKFILINHQPALICYKDDTLLSCQVFDWDTGDQKIKHVYAVVDPDKLKNISMS